MAIKRLLIITIVFLTFFQTCVNFTKATSNKPIHWGFKKSHNEQPAEAGKQLDELLEKYGAFYKGDTTKKDIYLTFDNGYENGFTEKILDILKEEAVPATFFITGHYLKTAPQLVKRMVNENHIIGNHSWHHPDLTKVSDDRLREELRKVKDGVEKLTNQKVMNYLRPPRGIFSERTMKLANEEGYTHVFWSLAFIDWYTNKQKGWQYAYDEVMSQIHPGSILLLHTVSKDNADALEKIIKDLKKRGYQFKSLDNLLMSQILDDFNL